MKMKKTILATMMIIIPIFAQANDFHDIKQENKLETKKYATHYVEKLNENLELAMTESQSNEMINLMYDYINNVKGAEDPDTRYAYKIHFNNMLGMTLSREQLRKISEAEAESGE